MQKQNQNLIVCLVDDDSIYRFTAERTIAATQVQGRIISFPDGKAALAFLANEADNNQLPDIIFLDINMPEIDGWQFLDQFKQLKSQLDKSIVIYMVSSSIDELDIKRSQTYEEVSGYLVKPVHKERFEEILSRFYPSN